MIQWKKILKRLQGEHSGRTQIHLSRTTIITQTTTIITIINKTTIIIMVIMIKSIQDRINIIITTRNKITRYV
jgi:hypothetical protein